MCNSRITNFRCMKQPALELYAKRKIFLQSLVRDKSFKAEVTYSSILAVSITHMSICGSRQRLRVPSCF